MCLFAVDWCCIVIWFNLCLYNSVVSLLCCLFCFNLFSCWFYCSYFLFRSVVNIGVCWLFDCFDCFECCGLFVMVFVWSGLVLFIVGVYCGIVLLWWMSYVVVLLWLLGVWLCYWLFECVWFLLVVALVLCCCFYLLFDCWWFVRLGLFVRCWFCAFSGFGLDLICLCYGLVRLFVVIMF